MIALQAVMVIY